MSFVLTENNALAHKCEQIGTTWVWWLVRVWWDEEGKIIKIDENLPQDEVGHWTDSEIRQETALLETDIGVLHQCPPEIMKWRRRENHYYQATDKAHAIALYLEWELKQRIIFYYFYKDPTRGYSHYSENNGRLTSVMMSDGSMFERTSISMENITSMEVDDPLHWRSG